MARPLSALLFAVDLVVLPFPGASQSSSQSNRPTYQCEGGPNAAIIGACGARWEAANIRAHVAVGAYGGATSKCLTKTALLLNDIAEKWLRKNTFRSYNGPWPCGKEPSIGKADDGVLNNACPGAVWSYDNRGAAGCSVSGRSAPKPAAYVPPPTPKAAPIDSYFLATAMAGSQGHHGRWWDGLKIGAGDYHDRVVTNTVSINGCTFDISQNEVDYNGTRLRVEWSGNFRNANPYGISTAVLSWWQPTEWALRFESVGRANWFTFSTNTSNNARWQVETLLNTNPYPIIDELRQYILWCQGS
jgi:hypothetical protein